MKYIVDTLIRDGKVVRPILGISYLESKQARVFGIERDVLVLVVPPPGSLPAEAGLKGTRRTETGLVEMGDIIVAINSKAYLFQALVTYQPGDTVELKVLRLVAVSDSLVQKEITLYVRLQSSKVLKQEAPTSVPDYQER